MPDPIAQFAGARHISLETFRKSGVGVRTAVWFAQAPAPPLRDTLARVEMDHPEPGSASLHEEPEPGVVFYVYTLPDSGKVKRIRNNPKVRIAPCDIRGNVRGAWVDGRARLCEREEAEQGQNLLRQKYGWMKRFGDFFSRLRGRRQVIIAVHLS